MNRYGRRITEEEAAAIGEDRREGYDEPGPLEYSDVELAAAQERYERAIGWTHD